MIVFYAAQFLFLLFVVLRSKPLPEKKLDPSFFSIIFSIFRERDKPVIVLLTAAFETSASHAISFCLIPFF